MSKKSKTHLVSSIVLWVSVWVGIGVFYNLGVRADLGVPNYSKTACVDVFFTGGDQKRQQEVFEFLRSEMPYSETNAFCESMASSVPFFRAGYIKLSIDIEELKNIETEVRRRIGKSFPDLAVSIEAHSTLGTDGNRRSSKFL